MVSLNIGTVEISTAVTSKVSTFIDYSLIVVLILMIYFIFRFFTVGGPSKEDKDNGIDERRQAFMKWYDEKKKKRGEADKRVKKEKEMKKKEDLVSPIKKGIMGCIDACDEAVSLLDSKSVSGVKNAAKKFNKEAHDAWTGLRLLTKKLKGPEHDAIRDLINQLEAVRKKVEDELKGTLPKRVDPTWAKTTEPIRAAVQSVRGSCGAIFKKLEEFHNK